MILPSPLVAGRGSGLSAPQEQNRNASVTAAISLTPRFSEVDTARELGKLFLTVYSLPPPLTGYKKSHFPLAPGYNSVYLYLEAAPGRTPAGYP